MLSLQVVRIIAQPKQVLVLCEELGRLQDKGLLNNPCRQLGLGRTDTQTTEIRRLQDNLKTPPITERRQTNMRDGHYHTLMSSR